jgi:hypothetical protein
MFFGFEILKPTRFKQTEKFGILKLYRKENDLTGKNVEGFFNFGKLEVFITT